VAQGFANIGVAFFGGITATGTIARTATNIGSVARTPIAGIVHSLVLLALMLVAAPLASYIPLAALASVLAVVAWNMAEKDAFIGILRRSRGDALVLLATFLLTVFRDLTEGIAVGVVLGSVLFMHRMAQLVQVETDEPLIQEDEADQPGAPAYEGVGSGDTLIYRITGPFFFGAASEVAQVLDRIGEYPEAFVLDSSGVPFVDSTAAHALQAFVEKARREGASVQIAASPAVRRA
jgi:SulP family sulfate permease